MRVDLHLVLNRTMLRHAYSHAYRHLCTHVYVDMQRSRQLSCNEESQHHLPRRPHSAVPVFICQWAGGSIGVCLSVGTCVLVQWSVPCINPTYVLARTRSRVHSCMHGAGLGVQLVLERITPEAAEWRSRGASMRLKQISARQVQLYRVL